MANRTLFVLLGTIVALLGAWVAVWNTQGHDAIPPIRGKNSTVLFLVTGEHGLTNVHLATAQALVEEHPDITIHWVTFAKFSRKVNQVSAAATKKNPASKPIQVQSLSGVSFAEACGRDGGADMITPPGLQGIKKFSKTIDDCMSPWTAKDHYSLYQTLGKIIDEVDPAVVVLDQLFGPAMDAAREKNRLHSIISPNTLVDMFAGEQPFGAIFWKYPALGSGHPFPVPWSLVPANAYQVVRFIISVLMTPNINAKRTFLKAQGLTKPIDFFAMHQTNAPWISQALPEASVPLDYIPANVTMVGPIVLSVASVLEQDPELHAWLERAPTVLINLGSSVLYDEERAKAMTNAVKIVLENSDVQVLWKFQRSGHYSDDFKAPVADLISSGRFRIETWIAADPTSILESGHVVASVHHGGSNCYHETVSTGLPHVILPLWLDLYNFASLVEQQGTGVWGCRETAPEWTAECLSDAILRVVDDGAEGVAIRRKAAEIGAIAAKSLGRYGAARQIAQLARGHYERDNVDGATK